MLRYLALVWLLGLAVGCSTSAQKSREALDTPIVVQSKTEPNTNFAAYRTWDFIPLREGAQIDPRLDNPEFKTTLRDAVEREMFTRGYRRAENPDSADLLLNVHVAIEEVDAAYIQKHYETAYEPGYRTDIDGQKLGDEWKEGTMILIMFDSDTKIGVWGATGRAQVLPGLDPETRRQRIDKAVRMIMETLPAQK